MLKDYFFLAFSNLRHRGIRSWLTILGIFIGIAAVVSLISLGAGLKVAVTGQFSSLSIDTITLQNKGSGFGPPGSSVVEKLNEDDVKIVESVRGVEMVIPRIIRVVEMEFNGVSNFVYVSDIPPESEKADFVYESSGINAERGRLLDVDEKGRVLVGSSVIDNFGDKEVRIRSDLTIDGNEFEVRGILERTGSFQTNSVILMPREDIEETLEIENEYDLITIKVRNVENLGEVARDIEETLRRERNEDVGEETFQVETPEQSLESINEILNLINLIIIGIAAISLFVGGVGITNTMYTSVLERTKEIGVMKAIGARNSDILAIFLIEAGLLGLVGGFVGVMIGLGLAFGVAETANSFFGTNLISISIDYFLIGGAILFSLTAGIISGVLPAFQAAKLNVVEALRN